MKWSWLFPHTGINASLIMDDFIPEYPPDKKKRRKKKKKRTYSTRPTITHLRQLHAGSTMREDLVNIPMSKLLFDPNSGMHIYIYSTYYMSQNVIWRNIS